MSQSYFVKSQEKHLEFTKHIYVNYSMPLIYCCCHLLRIICFQEEEMKMQADCITTYELFYLFILTNARDELKLSKKMEQLTRHTKHGDGNVRWTHIRHENRDQEPETEFKTQFLRHVLDLPRGLCWDMLVNLTWEAPRRHPS